jgi:hypothetical protein
LRQFISNLFQDESEEECDGTFARAGRYFAHNIRGITVTHDPVQDANRIHFLKLIKLSVLILLGYARSHRSLNIVPSKHGTILGRYNG